MIQLHIVHSIEISFGGLGLAALRYSEAIAKAGAQVLLFVCIRAEDELEYSEVAGRFSIAGVESILGYGSKKGFTSQIYALHKMLSQNHIDVIHLHGIWSPLLAIAAFIAQNRDIPVAISPHGCLEPWALEHRKLKKQIALMVYQARILRKTPMLFATAKKELESIRNLCLPNPVAVLPNGVDLTLGRYERPKGMPRRILFLSRIHPKKGIKDLILAWKMVRQPNWKVIIAGPDEDGHTAELISLTQSLGLASDFEFPGLVAGEAKEIYFSESDLFVLPTYSENFGIAIAEALARGLPVITTIEAPWENLETWRCGWWVPPGVDGIALALVAAMNTPREELDKMGERGIQLVKEKYSWDQIGRCGLQAYEWMLGYSQKRPDFVDIKINPN